MFLQHLAVKEHSSFFYLLNSDITGGVVHNYAFSCIHRHIRCRQRKCAWNLDGAHAVVVNAEPLLPYTVDLFCIEHFDFFHQFIQHPGCQLFCSGVLANQTDKHMLPAVLAGHVAFMAVGQGALYPPPLGLYQPVCKRPGGWVVCLYPAHQRPAVQGTRFIRGNVTTV